MKINKEDKKIVEKMRTRVISECVPFENISEMFLVDEQKGTLTISNKFFKSISISINYTKLGDMVVWFKLSPTISISLFEVLHYIKHKTFSNTPCKNFYLRQINKNTFGFTKKPKQNFNAKEEKLKIYYKRKEKKQLIAKVKAEKHQHKN
jgi:hypothetical protein